MKKQPALFPKPLYRLRARVENLIGKTKRFKRIALRCEKTAQNFAPIIALVFVFVLIKSVYTV